jgi:hypothetical protein
MRRVERSVTHRFLGRALAGIVLGALLAAAAWPAAAQSQGRSLAVPEDYPTLEAAIAASQPGDVILLAAGVYAGGIVVPEDKPGITIRGADRNAVVFDGQNRVDNAIEVEADDVALENMSAHDYAQNGFYWDGVEGFQGRYLTVWNVGLYGIYAIESRDGVIEQSYVSGAADAAFYIGECDPCDSLLENNTAALSAVGFSGTNASGNLTVRNSRFENNGVGILPNSFDVGLAPPPQRSATFQNQVTGSTRYGIVVVATVDRGTNWLPSGNTIRNNVVSGSGTADLAIAAGGGADNCFEADNQAATTDPADLAGTCVAEGGGSEAVAAELMRPPPALQEGLPTAPNYSTMPVPSPQVSMAAPLPATAPSNLPWIALIAALLLAVVVMVVVVARRFSPSRG